VGVLVIPVVLALLVVGLAALLWQPLKSVVPCFGCGNQSVTVQVAARQWGTRTVDHFGAPLNGRLRCVIPAADANPDRIAFPVTCTGTTTSGQPVRLVGSRAAIAGNNDDYLSGAWSVDIGVVNHNLSCLPSNWRRPSRCATGSG
jgi:hypothetical protein